MLAYHYKYWYQEQERQTDLDLNWDSFKYRNYDYAIGRFMSVDPLAEKYPYNGMYNFSENRVIDARELEGLEKWLIGGEEVYGPQLPEEIPEEIHGPYLNQIEAENAYYEQNKIELEPIEIDLTQHENIKEVLKSVKETFDIISDFNNISSALSFILESKTTTNASNIISYETAALSIGLDYMSNDNKTEFVNNTVETTITTVIGKKQPILGIGVGIILEDSRRADGLTNLNNGRLANAYRSNYNQTQSYFRAHFYNPEVYANTPKVSDLFDTIANRFKRWKDKLTNSNNNE